MKGKAKITKWEDLQGRVPDRILGRWMDMVEEDTDSWPDWSDMVPQWALDLI